MQINKNKIIQNMNKYCNNIKITGFKNYAKAQ